MKKIFVENTHKIFTTKQNILAKLAACPSVFKGHTFKGLVATMFNPAHSCDPSA